MKSLTNYLITYRRQDHTTTIIINYYYDINYSYIC